MDIREHYERKLERANNLYMELSAIMLQLEMREKELIKYVASSTLSALIDLGLSMGRNVLLFHVAVLGTGRYLIPSPTMPSGMRCAQPLTLVRFTVAWDCHRAGCRGTCT